MTFSDPRSMVTVEPQSRGLGRSGARRLRWVAAIAVGLVVVLLIAGSCFWVVRATWPAYVAAEPTKAYTLAMLLVRLAIGAVATAGAACAATLVAGDQGRMAWWLGALFLLVSLPSHLYFVWDDYPAWYHFVYLAYLVPVAGYSARWLRAIQTDL